MDAGCLLCTSGTVCVSCDQGYSLNPSTSKCELILTLTMVSSPASTSTSSTKYRFDFSISSPFDLDLPLTTGSPTDFSSFLAISTQPVSVNSIITSILSDVKIYNFSVEFQPNETANAGAIIEVGFWMLTVVGSDIPCTFQNNALNGTFSIPALPNSSNTSSSDSSTPASNLGRGFSGIIAAMKILTWSTALSNGGSSSNSFLTLSLVDLSRFIRYVDTQFPPNAEEFFLLFSEDFTDFGPVLFELAAGNDLIDNSIAQLPPRFRVFEDSTLFLQNLSTLVFWMVLMLSGIVLLKLICYVFSSNYQCVKKLEKLRITLQWNFFIGKIMESYPELILSFFLQSQDYLGRTTLSLVSLGMSSFLGPLIIALPLLFFIVVSNTFKVRLSKLERKVQESVLGSRKSIRILFAELQPHKKHFKSYTMIVMYRIILVVPSLVLAQGLPGLQLGVSIAGSLLMIVYHAFFRVLKEEQTNVKVIINEILLLGSYIVAFGCFGGSDPTSSLLKRDTASIFGWVLIGFTIAMVVFNLLWTIFELWVSLKELKKSCSKKKGNKSVPAFTTGKKISLKTTLAPVSPSKTAKDPNNPTNSLN